LCTHHATGKKVIFAEFVRQFGDEIREAVDGYLNNYDASFYKWIEDSISPMVADGIASEWEEISSVARMINQLLAGEEITIGDGELSAQTMCQGPPRPSPNQITPLFQRL